MSNAITPASAGAGLSQRPVRRARFRRGFGRLPPRPWAATPPRAGTPPGPAAAAPSRLDPPAPSERRPKGASS